MDTLAFIARYEEMLRDKRIPKMQFYRECGVSDAAVSQWRKGKTNPSMTTVNAIAKYLGTSSEYLITGQSLKKEKPATVSGDELDETTREIMNILYDLTPEELALAKARLLKIKESR